MNLPEPSARRARDEPLALHTRAMDNLRFIRETMERAGSFTAVPGWGIVAIGATAVVAAVVASVQPTPARWLVVWLADAAVALVIAAVALVRKSRRAGIPLFAHPTRRFALSFAPPLFVGAVLTPVVYAAASVHLLPGVWLLLYGTGVVTGGAFSVRPVPLLGLSVMGVGVLALLLPVWTNDAVMALGFGVLHMVFGVLIARRHGG